MGDHDLQAARLHASRPAVECGAPANIYSSRGYAQDDVSKGRDGSDPVAESARLGAWVGAQATPQPTQEPQSMVGRKRCPQCKTITGPRRIMCECGHVFQTRKPARHKEMLGKGKKQCPACRLVTSSRQATCSCGYLFYQRTEEEGLPSGSPARCSSCLSRVEKYGSLCSPCTTLSLLRGDTLSSSLGPTGPAQPSALYRGLPGPATSTSFGDVAHTLNRWGSSDSSSQLRTGGGLAHYPQLPLSRSQSALQPSSNYSGALFEEMSRRGSLSIGVSGQDSSSATTTTLTCLAPLPQTIPSHPSSSFQSTFDIDAFRHSTYLPNTRSLEKFRIQQHDHTISPPAPPQHLMFDASELGHGDRHQPQGAMDSEAELSQRKKRKMSGEAEPAD